MNYVAFVGSEGRTPPDQVEIMNRDFPAYFAEMDRRGVRLLGRELDFPNTAVTVRVRDGETLVSDGPFAETKEQVAGLDLLDCADLDEAIEVEGKSPVARFLPFEIRPLRGELRLGPGTPAFAQGDDSAGIPYMLMVWSGTPEAPVDDPALMREYVTWREEREAEGVFILGSALEGPDTATTLRPGDGTPQLSDGPFLDLEEFIAGVDVVSCADRAQAIQVATTHPQARYHAIEVRPFYTE
jgi:hypothetical protein